MRRVERKFNWANALFFLALSGALIAPWVAILLARALSAISRDAIVLFDAPELVVALATLVMLGGVVLFSIQVAAIVEELVHGE